jgi:uncharacterized protein YbaA (DUF1428 family)
MVVIALAAAGPLAAAEKSSENWCYELRIYTPAEGKADALHKRFREHTVDLFKKHGMTNVGYFNALDPADERLYYILSYPDRETRDASWKSFLNDPAWKTAHAESEKNGKLVSKIESQFLHPTAYSPQVKVTADGAPRVFELRTYTATPGNLKNLHQRFSDHTVELFEKHGMQNIGYWELDDGQKGSDETLIYLLAHKSKEARDASFDAFRQDPDWVKAREASEKNAGGSLTAKDGVQSLMLKPTDYSPMK